MPKSHVAWNKGLTGVQKGWNKGVPMTESAKAKLSESCKGRIPWNKGLKMSEETKKKVSESCKDHWANPENRKKLSDAHLGQKAWCKGLSVPEEVKAKISKTKKSQNRHHTKEHKAKISAGQMGEKNQFFGKRHSEETKKIISGKLKTINTSEKFIGKNNPNWHGGISFEPYCHVWTDLEFKESIKDRDAYKCQNPYCSGTSTKLCIHHINYIKKDCTPFNLITLCLSCNSKANGNREYWTQFYNDILFFNQRLMQEQELLKTIRCA